MKKEFVIWRIFTVYIIALVLMLLCGTAFGQVQIVVFNAGWNEANSVSWVEELTECKLKYIEKIDKKENPVDLNNPFTGYC